MAVVPVRDREQQIRGDEERPPAPVLRDVVPLVAEQRPLHRLGGHDHVADRHRRAAERPHHRREPSRPAVEHQRSSNDVRPLEGERSGDQPEQRVRQRPDETERMVHHGDVTRPSALVGTGILAGMGETQAGAVVDVPEVARELGERFGDAGHELYLVGGAVRDALLQRPTADHDLDLATSAPPQETIRLLRAAGVEQLYLMGVKYGTIGARKDDRRLEITTFREEVYREEDRKPVVTFASDIRTDLSRRDFTINAMAILLPGGEFEDPFGGLKDLAAKRIDTPLEPEVAFSEDPLRMLRAARFGATLEMQPTPRVIDAIERMHDRLSIISAERIRDELDKLLLADRPSIGLDLIVETGLAEEFLPELLALRLEQDPVHKHKDVLRHTYAVVENTELDLVLRLAALMHDFGKPKTRSITPEGVQFHSHDVVGARIAEERLRALRYPSETVHAVRDLVWMHMRFHTYGMGWTDGAVRRYVRDAGPLLDRLNQLTRADCTTRNPQRAAHLRALQNELEERIARLAEEENLQALRPPLDGNEVIEHLGLKPGREIGEALQFLMELRLERGPMEKDDAYRELDAWARGRGIER
jgi:poly(A) polymerase